MLSIIIPTWNEETHLPRLLKSIKVQSYTDYEIIIADAGSKDKTKQIARKFGCSIVKGGMPAVGRNSGARASKGDVLLFLDADSYLEKDFISDAMEILNRKSLDIAGVYPNPITKKISIKFFFLLFKIWIFSTQLFYPNASGCGIISKRKMHFKVGGFDEKITVSEDMDYVRRCSKYGKFRIINLSVKVSARRFETFGPWSTAFKLFFTTIYRSLFGEIRSKMFRYDLRYRKGK